MNKSFVNKFTILISILIGIAVFFSWFVNGDDDQWNGYEYVWGREDNVHLSKDGLTIVKSTIINIDISDNFIVGLRLPAKNVTCDGGAGSNIMLVNNEEYFILNSSTGVLHEFKDRVEFEKKLSSFEIKEKISLDYSRFKVVWDRYSNYYDDNKKYYSGCNDAERGQP
ncbi:hypothetical protein [Aliikangiella sp. IMCC44359]|uniref:hypothetical protein n=1 Tax=Aliikangiella sp. IMCC44359 TaxID=3459125 RepID=UPI00403A8153